MPRAVWKKSVVPIESKFKSVLYVVYHNGYGAKITVYQFGQLLPKLQWYDSNFDNYSSNSIVSDE